MRGLILAFRFLTIIPIPVRVRGGVSALDLSRSAVFFPAVGAFQGLLAASVATVSLKLFTGEVASVLAISAMIMSNGGFHLDGLADTFDGLAVKSSGDRGADRERRLSVMKDSATGAIGVVAVVLAIILKYLILADLLMKAPKDTASSLLFLMPVFSKWVIVASLYLGTSARQDGLGKMFIDSVTISTVILSSFCSILFCFIVSALYLYPPYGPSVLALFFSLYAVFTVFSFAAGWFCKRRFGGLAGDNFGAINEIAEILFLFMAVLWLQRSI
ncbi:MAG TPA: adenosylcobinamide-GDP ribazoletransferase [Thermodesulfovibrionales bacterium]|nr:adenosylcobinamide-GDP ribazoletransferase [Thermodesulfovibrionales bacterium]